MKNIIKMTVALMVVVSAFAYASPSTAVTKRWALRNIVNRIKGYVRPVWPIFQPGTAKSVKWVSHEPNTRFAVYDYNGDSDTNIPATLSDDLVLDRETGVVWARDANLAGTNMTLQDAVFFVHGVTGFGSILELAGRKAWRLPTVCEFQNLIDPSQSSPALPEGHPFINIQPNYWTMTSMENNDTVYYYIRPDDGSTGFYNETNTFYVWPVRAGNAPVR